MKKFKLLLLIAVPLLIITMILAIFLLKPSQNNNYEEISAFLASDPDAVISMRSVLGDFVARPGHELEIVIELDTENIFGQAYIDEHNDSTTSMLSNFLDSGTEFFTNQASAMREQLNFSNLTLTIAYLLDGDIITYQQFEAR